MMCLNNIYFKAYQVIWPGCRQSFSSALQSEVRLETAKIRAKGTMRLFSGSLMLGEQACHCIRQESAVIFKSGYL